MIKNFSVTSFDGAGIFHKDFFETAAQADAEAVRRLNGHYQIKLNDLTGIPDTTPEAEFVPQTFPKRQGGRRG